MGNFRANIPAHDGCPGRCLGRHTPARGFSLADLLVSIAVMAILISILTPSLMSAHEAARRVRCASNVYQIGLALQMYAYERQNHLPPASFPPASWIRQNEPGLWSADTLFLRLTPSAEIRAGATSASSPKGNWDGLGILYELNYLNHPGVFYCPSHHGNHSFRAYTDAWINAPGKIGGNYQYRVPATSSFISDLNPSTTIVADGLQTKLDYNHLVGNNFLRVDLRVSWYNDSNGALYQSLPDTAPTGPTGTGGGGSGWEHLDHGQGNAP